jgi:hypothetical protein
VLVNGELPPEEGTAGTTPLPIENRGRLARLENKFDVIVEILGEALDLIAAIAKMSGIREVSEKVTSLQQRFGQR